MNVDIAAETIGELLGAESSPTTWQKGGTAFARVVSRGPEERFAVVSTPGNRWCEVAVDGGFALIEFAEDLTDDEVRSVLEKMCGIATAYVENGATLTGARRFSPRLSVAWKGAKYSLSRSLADDIGHLVKRPFRLGN